MDLPDIFQLRGEDSEGWLANAFVRCTECNVIVTDEASFKMALAEVETHVRLMH